MGYRGDPHGRSKYTLYKEALIGLYLYGNLEIFDQTSGIYIHVDLNAGTGINKIPKLNGNGEHVVKGTVSLFLDQIKRWRVKGKTIPYRAAFMEKHRDHFAVLKARYETLRGQTDLFPIQEEQTRLFIHVDNAEFLSKMRASNAFGSIIADPNGISKKSGGFPLVELGKVATRCPNLSIIIRYDFGMAIRPLSANRYWRPFVEQHGLARDRLNNGDRKKSGKEGWWPSRLWEVFSLEDIFANVQRPYWLISVPFGGQVIMVGSSRPIRNVRNPRLPVQAYSRSSSDGVNVIRAINRQLEYGGKLEYQRENR